MENIKKWPKIPESIIKRKEKQTNEDICIVEVSEQHSMSLKLFVSHKHSAACCSVCRVPVPTGLCRVLVPTDLALCSSDVRFASIFLFPPVPNMLYCWPDSQLSSARFYITSIHQRFHPFRSIFLHHWSDVAFPARAYHTHEFSICVPFGVDFIFASVSVPVMFVPVSFIDSSVHFILFSASNLPVYSDQYQSVPV